MCITVVCGEGARQLSYFLLVPDLGLTTPRELKGALMAYIRSWEERKSGTLVGCGLLRTTAERSGFTTAVFAQVRCGAWSDADWVAGGLLGGGKMGKAAESSRPTSTGREREREREKREIKRETDSDKRKQI